MEMMKIIEVFVDLLAFILIFGWVALGFLCWGSFVLLESFQEQPYEVQRSIADALKSIANYSDVWKIYYMPVTCCIMLLCTAIWISMKYRGLGPEQVGISYNNIIKDKEYWRLLVAQFAHGGILHFIINMACLWQIGVTEIISTSGSQYFFKMTVILLVVIGLMYISIFHVLERSKILQHPNKVMIGFSCMYYGWITINTIKFPQLIEQYGILGSFGYSIFCAPLGSLADNSLQKTRVSFIGHLSGIISGFIVGAGNFDKIGNSEFGALLFGIFLGVCLSKVFNVACENDKSIHEDGQCRMANNGEEHQD